MKKEKTIIIRIDKETSELLDKALKSITPQGFKINQSEFIRWAIQHFSNEVLTDKFVINIHKM